MRAALLAVCLGVSLLAGCSIPRPTPNAGAVIGKHYAASYKYISPTLEYDWLNDEFVGGYEELTAPEQWTITISGNVNGEEFQKTLRVSQEHWNRIAVGDWHGVESL